MNMKELTKKQIIEGNKLIKRFDSFKWIGTPDYHKSFNNSMPVWVKVCEIINNLEKLDLIHNNYCEISEKFVAINILFAYGFETNYSLSEYDLNSALFLAIVDFFKWYNENKEVVK